METLPGDLTKEILRTLLEDGLYDKYLSMCQTNAKIRNACRHLEEKEPAFWYNLLERKGPEMKRHLEENVEYDNQIGTPGYGKIIEYTYDTPNYEGKTMYQLWKIYIIRGVTPNSSDKLPSLKDAIREYDIGLVKYHLHIDDTKDTVNKRVDSSLEYVMEEDVLEEIRDHIESKA